MYVIIGNYGNETIALIQWAKQQNLTNVYVLNVDTGWQAETWQRRVVLGQTLTRNYGFTPIQLSVNPNFIELIKQRRQFPNKKFQWCVSFLKGIPINDWLEEFDIEQSTVILQAKRFVQSKLFQHLQTWTYHSEYYGDRTVWNPLLDYTDSQFEQLIIAAGFALLPHRSLECEPCIHASDQEIIKLADSDRLKTQALEQDLQQTFFSIPIAELQKTLQQKNHLVKTSFDMGCGSPYACGE